MGSDTMKLWMKKALFALIVIATLGMYTPTALLDIDAEENKNDLASKADFNDTERPYADHTIAHSLYDAADDLQILQQQAKEQSLEKLGPRIEERVGDEFNEIILPQIESVLKELYTRSSEDQAKYLGITERPAKGYGERIFNVADLRTEEDLARFHVRRENRPLEGYYFNFHYHLRDDDFKEHYDLGEIYWDKNTPPKWMT